MPPPAQSVTPLMEYEVCRIRITVCEEEQDSVKDGFSNEDTELNKLVESIIDDDHEESGDNKI